MTHAEAIAAIDVILTRAEKVDMGRLMAAWFYVRKAELVAARQALGVLGEHTNAALVCGGERKEAT